MRQYNDLDVNKAITILQDVHGNLNSFKDHIKSDYNYHYESMKDAETDIEFLLHSGAFDALDRLMQLFQIPERKSRSTEIDLRFSQILDIYYQNKQL